MNDLLITSTTVARIATDGKTARRLADGLSETLDAGETAIAAFEAPDGHWTVEIFFEQPPDEAALRDLVGRLAGQPAQDALAFERIAARDWVAASLEGLQPVEAGRFIVHGAHHRARVPANRIGIEIEAALAFGTGHHGTTRGCLLALDAIAKSRRRKTARLANALLGGGPSAPSPRLRGEGRGEGAFLLDMRSGSRKGPLTRREKTRQPLPARGERFCRTLDVGTGTGVLAIAAARSLRGAVLAGDIDSMSVRLARENVHLNRAAVTVIHARGLGDRRFRDGGPYQLVFANILLGPLKGLAKPIAAVAAPGAVIVLSGLLPQQANAALAAYRAHGLVLERRILLDGWATLILRRRGQVLRRRG